MTLLMLKTRKFCKYLGILIRYDVYADFAGKIGSRVKNEKKGWRVIEKATQ